MDKKWVKSAAILAGATFLGLSLSIEVYLGAVAEMQAGYKVDYLNLAIPQFGRAFMWAALAPLILQMLEKMPLERGRWAGGVLFHLFMSHVVMATFYLGRMKAYFIIWGMSQPHGESFWQAALHRFHGHNMVDLVYYWAVIAFGYGSQFYRKYKHGETRAAQLEARLIEAELRALKQQLNPHFLFNTMNTISVLVRERNNDEAVQLIARLGALLRMTLDNTRVQSVTLRQELDFLTRYLEIQKSRFGDRLQYRTDVEPAALDAVIPNLILQPSVENAIIHGIAQKQAPGTVEIIARVNAGRLDVEVRDDGPGFVITGDRINREGIGLTNTRIRLERHYGKDQQMVVRSELGHGVSVRLIFPFTTSVKLASP